MRRFEVDFEYTVVNFETVEVEAEDEDEAEYLADDIITRKYPEATDFFLIETRETN